MNPIGSNKYSWSHQEDRMLADVMLEFAQTDKTQDDTFEIAAERIAGRTKHACARRWMIIKSRFLSFYEREMEFERKNKSDQTTETSETDQDEELIDRLLKGDLAEKEKRKLTGFYLDSDILQILDILGKKGGRGAKNRIANDAIRKYFIVKGLL